MEDVIKESNVKNFFKALWGSLESKGKLATLIGLVFSLPANINFLITYFQGTVLSTDQIEQLFWMNVIGVIWFILPSEITIKAKSLEIVVKD